MGFRQFELSFSLTSRNPKESKEIQEIIAWFKHGMHPVSSNGKGGAGVLTFPDVLDT